MYVLQVTLRNFLVSSFPIVSWDETDETDSLYARIPDFFMAEFFDMYMELKSWDKTNPNEKKMGFSHSVFQFPEGPFVSFA